MKKRILSFILITAMLIGMLPSIAFADNSVSTDADIVYSFTVEAIADESLINTDDKGTQSVKIENVTDISKLNSNVSSGLWNFYAKVGFTTSALYSNNTQMRVDLANIGMNGIVLKTGFSKAATYSANVSFAKNAANGRTNIYFVPVAYVEENAWEISTADGINAAIADSANSNSSVKLAASVDMHTNSTDESPFKGNTFDVVPGDYYIIINVTKGCTDTSNSRYFTMLSSIGLVKEMKKSSKISPTIYTTEMRKNAIVNAKKYAWAQAEVKAAKAKADKYVDKVDGYYNAIIGEGIPRSGYVGLRGDYNSSICRYCGTDIMIEYGRSTYNIWDVDVVANPWKVKCPACKHMFPTNDFESFYKLGLKSDGTFDRALALEKHEELFGGTYGVGYLKNDLYPEVATVSTLNCGEGLRSSESVATWGVDDGFGYNTGINNFGTDEVHTYIPHYVFKAWEKVETALNDLSKAYVYTGDEKYGKVGAVLVDRIADVYPGLDMTQYNGKYYIASSTQKRGKMQGSSYDCAITTNFITAYDAFWPMYDNSEVIAYLSEKAAEYGMGNDKTSADKIRRNCEEGILRASFDAVKNGNVNGNFGMHQKVVASAAIALDGDECGEMLDWIFATNTGNSYSPTGGDFAAQLINKVNRDGTGNESAPGYNNIWIDNMLDVALMTAKVSEEYGSLFEHPKYAKMFTAQIPLFLANSYTAQIGDQGSTAGLAKVGTLKSLVECYKYIENAEEKIKLAQYIYLLNGNSVDGLPNDIFAKNPEGLASEIAAIIKQHGEFSLESEMLADYGFAVLRGGSSDETIHDTWVSFGINGDSYSHSHLDVLNLGMDAYGLNIAPDLGYPEQTGNQPNRLQWVRTTLSHNTVVVDEKEQLSTNESATPIHFDDSGTVKLVDVSADNVYSQTENYRRTLVTVGALGDEAYTLDFFRVTGGNKHTYSFHSQSDEISMTDGLDLIPQVDESGNYIGSYAGADVPYGQDPYTQMSSNYETLYPRGYTWLDEVRRAKSVSGKFSVDFAVKDFNNAIENDAGIHLRVTQLNDFTADEVALAKGYPPRTANNMRIPSLEYLLVQRKGNDLDSLFTTVFEPYRNNRYIYNIESVPMVRNAGENPGLSDAYKAVKVTMADGKVDYVVYSSNNTVTYTVDDLFSFRGFVGVCTINQNGEIISGYINDGDTLGDERYENSAYTGCIEGFTPELSFGNYIDVSFDNAWVDPAEINGRYIYIENDGEENAVYKIEAVECIGSTYRLNLGNTTLIRSLKDDADIEAGYNYNISSGDSFRIPMSYTMDNAPVFDAMDENIVATVGRINEIKFNVYSPVGADIEYTAKVLPIGATLMEYGGIRWKPTENQLGENNFSIVAVDSDGRETVFNFSVNVIPEMQSGYVVSAYQDYESARLTLINENGLSTLRISPNATDLGGETIIDGSYVGDLSAYAKGSFVNYATDVDGNITVLDNEEGNLESIGLDYDENMVNGFWLVNVVSERNGVLSFFNTNWDIDLYNGRTYNIEYADGCKFIGIDEDKYAGEKLATIPDSITEISRGEGNAIIEISDGEIVRVYSFVNGSYVYGSGIKTPDSDETIAIDEIIIDEEEKFGYSAVTYLDFDKGLIEIDNLGIVALEDVILGEGVAANSNVVWYVEKDSLVVDVPETVRGAVEEFTEDTHGVIIGGKEYYPWINCEEIDNGDLFQYYMDNKSAMGADTEYLVYDGIIIKIIARNVSSDVSDYAVITRSYYDTDMDTAYVKLAFADNSEGTYQVGKTYLKNTREPNDEANSGNRPQDFANNRLFGIVVKYKVRDNGTLDLSGQDFNEILTRGNTTTKYIPDATGIDVYKGNLDGYYGLNDNTIVFALYGNPCYELDGEEIKMDATNEDYAPIKAKAYKLSELVDMEANAIDTLYVGKTPANAPIVSYVLNSRTDVNKYIVAAAMTVGRELTDGNIAYKESREFAYVVKATQYYDVKTDKYWAELTLINENGLFKAKTVENVTDFNSFGILNDGVIGDISDPRSDSCKFARGSFVLYHMNDEGVIDAISNEGFDLYDIDQQYLPESYAGLYRVNITSVDDGAISFINTDRDILSVEEAQKITVAYDKDNCKVIGMSGDIYIGEELDILPSDAMDIPEGYGNAILHIEDGKIVRIFSFNDAGHTLGDVSGDDTVDIRDAVRLFQYSMLPDSYPTEYTWNLDFNKDGKVDITDAVHLFRYSILPDKYPLV